MSSPSLHIEGAMLTDVGAVRQNNEDSVAYILPENGLPGLAIVADGMGGHAAGEVASSLAVSTICQMFYDAVGGIPERLAQAFDAANTEILLTAAENPASAGMGTTCTAIVLDAAGAWLAHIGDSRAYLLREGVLHQLSEDHSLVAAMVSDGRLTEAEAFTSPDRHIILRAMGIDRYIQPQIWSEPMVLAAEDTLLLCSDGLSDLLVPARITQLLAGNPYRACLALLVAAVEAGGTDNVSVGVFRVTASRPARRAAPRATREIPGPP